MKITRKRIREIVKETLNRRLVENNPAEAPPEVDKKNEPRQDIGALIKKIIDDGGDAEQIARLKDLYQRMDPAKKTQVVVATVRAITGDDLNIKHVKPAIMNKS
tara:strand:+ start:175 stop:486 length:312 start_codon:yes stop_codon:yes gene_type:complete